MHRVHKKVYEIFIRKLEGKRPLVRYRRKVTLIEHHAMKAYWGSRDIASHILDLGTRWR
jgi:hypothetical protein